MKAKLSTTIERPLVRYLDSLPGKTRAEKLERILATFQRLEEERQLRVQLGQAREDEEERFEREIWERTMDEALWSE